MKNHLIKIYGVIGRDVDLSDVDAQLAQAGGEPITILLNSPGGEVIEAGLGIYNAIKAYPGEVTIKIVAMAGSMASLIAMAGDKVLMSENGTFMIHPPYMDTSGTREDIAATMNLVAKKEEEFVKAYSEKTGLDREKVLDLLYPEKWMDAHEAKSLGFVDEILGESGDYRLVAEALKTAKGVPESVKVRMLASIGDSALDRDSESAEVQDKKSLEADFKLNELSRKKQVKAVFKEWLDDPAIEKLQESCLDDLDVSASDAKVRLLAYLNHSNAASPATGHRSMAHAGNGRVVRDAIVQAICVQTDLEHDDKGVDRNPFVHRSLLAMAEQSLKDRREGYSGQDDLFQRVLAHSSSDFHEALLESCKRSVSAGYSDVVEDFYKWTSSGYVSDFRKVKRLDYSQFSDLLPIPESGEIYQGDIEESGENVFVLEYGRKFKLTRKMLVNDDVDALISIPRAMAQAAKRLIGDLSYGVLINGHKMADGRQLYDASRGNVIQASALDMSVLDDAMTQMALFKDPISGQALNINPEFLITSRKLRSRAVSLATSDKNPDDRDEENTIKGDFSPISNARIDASAKAGKSPAFLVAGGLHKPVHVSYLQNKREPSLEKTQDWTGRDMEFGVFIDTGVQAVNPRGVMRLDIG